MNDYERERARAWLRQRRGTMSQDALVQDIAATMPAWNITRDRYSKYESGGTPFGAKVLAQFIDYWAAKGQPGPDFTPPPEPEPVPDLATAIVALATELRAWREERESIEVRLRAAEAALEGLRAGSATEVSPVRSAPPARAG